MALYHETDLKLTCESGSQRGCSMWVTVRWGRGCGRKVVPAHVDNGACNTTVSVVSWGCKWMFQVCVCLLLWSLTSPGSTGWGFLLMHCVCVCVCVCVCMNTLSHVLLFVTPWTVAQQAPLSMEFSRQEYWIILPFPSPGGLPNWRICISHVSCIGQQVLYQLSHQGSPTKRRQFYIMLIYINGVGTCQCFPKH